MKTVGYKIWAKYQPASRRPVDSKRKPVADKETFSGLVDVITYTMSGIGYWDEKSLYIAQISQQGKPYIREIELANPEKDENGWYTDQVVELRPLPDGGEKPEYLYIRFTEK